MSWLNAATCDGGFQPFSASDSERSADVQRNELKKTLAILGTFLAVLPATMLPGATPSNDPVTFTDIHAPLLFCNAEGKVVSWTLPAGNLLHELGVARELPGPLPRSLWAELERTVPGEALEWRLPSDAGRLLGCTRYRARGGYLLILKEISQQRAALSKLLQRQRLEVTGRLVASIAHELRNSVASIIYNAQLVELTTRKGTPEDTEDAAQGIQTAAKHLEATVRGLLEYARAAPPNSSSVDLEGVVNRASGFLRAVFREGSHCLEFTSTKEARWVQGNTIAVEQILVNLLLNAAEAAEAASTRVNVTIHASCERPPGANRESSPMVRAQISDDGPGIPPHLRELIFQPFYTTTPDGTGLGLTNAREAIEQLGGFLVLEPSNRGARFSAYFPLGKPHA